MAITIDDLPFVGDDRPAGAIDRQTDRLLAALRRHQATAIGFVNEEKLESPETRLAGIARLNRWLDAGMPLGNHTYSHRSLSTVPVGEYEADVLKGEVVTRTLMQARGLELRWFRHPMTHTGPTAAVKARFESFLAEHRYQVAPFTIEHGDYIFARVWRDYAGVDDRRDELTRLRRDYLAHLETMTTYFERLSHKVFGRGIPQVLLIHANALNAECLDDMLSALKARGYRFVTLEHAMQDEAYRTADRFVGTFGPSWIHRWGIARGVPMSMRDEPDPPTWVLDAFARHAGR